MPMGSPARQPSTSPANLALPSSDASSNQAPRVLTPPPAANAALAAPLLRLMTWTYTTKGWGVQKS